MTATMKKLGVVAVLFALVASIGLFGCSSNNESKDTNAESADYTLLNDGKLGSRSFSRLSTIRKSRRRRSGRLRS